MLAFFCLNIFLHDSKRKMSAQRVAFENGQAHRNRSKTREVISKKPQGGNIIIAHSLYKNVFFNQSFLWIFVDFYDLTKISDLLSSSNSCNFFESCSFRTSSGALESARSETFKNELSFVSFPGSQEIGNTKVGLFRIFKLMLNFYFEGKLTNFRDFLL